MLFLTFLISGISVCVGYASALLINHWLLKSARAEVTAAREDAEISVNLERHELHEFFAHVQSVTVTVDGSMDRHITRVAAFNDNIVQNVAKDPKAILRAAKQLLEANVQLQEELHSAREQVSVKQLQIETYISDARTDGLTEIANRRAFDHEIRRLFAQRQRQGVSFALLLADIDHFKWFNDYHGHQVGDEMLRLVAGTLSHTLRDMDLVCRYGGEEFAMILPETSLPHAIRTSERVHEALEQMSHRVENAQLRVTVSIGVAEVRGDENVESFIKRVDEALYAAKHAGRNCTCYHDGEKCLPASVLPKVEDCSGRQTAPPHFDGLDASDPAGEIDLIGANREQDPDHADVVAVG
ncbi:MAG: GGDEF domain-containing protein [Candidatus Saccharimonas sp.]|nr:GGDEF domain-containing protein [Planctomycetaceae bacterium]